VIAEVVLTPTQQIAHWLHVISGELIVAAVMLVIIAFRD